MKNNQTQIFLIISPVVFSYVAQMKNYGRELKYDLSHLKYFLFQNSKIGLYIVFLQKRLSNSKQL